MLAARTAVLKVLLNASVLYRQAKTGEYNCDKRSILLARRLSSLLLIKLKTFY